ncbi:MAG TPA: hypothetical protein VH062_30600 [Polyangiaceae bacterium]|nr:hypothetical protein [Polyangiaceae bacterium]
MAIVGALLLASAVGVVSCSTKNDDPLGRACNVLVHECHVLPDMSDCIDGIGNALPDDCVLCIAEDNDCSYFSRCQRADATCVLSKDLEPSGAGDP